MFNFQILVLSSLSCVYCKMLDSAIRSNIMASWLPSSNRATSLALDISEDISIVLEPFCNQFIPDHLYTRHNGSSPYQKRWGFSLWVIPLHW